MSPAQRQRETGSSEKESRNRINQTHGCGFTVIRVSLFSDYYFLTVTRTVSSEKESENRTKKNDGCGFTVIRVSLF